MQRSAITTTYTPPPVQPTTTTAAYTANVLVPGTQTAQSVMSATCPQHPQYVTEFPNSQYYLYKVMSSPQMNGIYNVSPYTPKSTTGNDQVAVGYPVENNKAVTLAMFHTDSTFKGYLTSQKNKDDCSEDSDNSDDDKSSKDDGSSNSDCDSYDEYKRNKKMQKRNRYRAQVNDTNQIYYTYFNTTINKKNRKYESPSLPCPLQFNHDNTEKVLCYYKPLQIHTSHDYEQRPMAILARRHLETLKNECLSKDNKKNVLRLWINKDLTHHVVPYKKSCKQYKKKERIRELCRLEDTHWILIPVNDTHGGNQVRENQKFWICSYSPKKNITLMNDNVFLSWNPKRKEFDLTTIDCATQFAIVNDAFHYASKYDPISSKNLLSRYVQ
jgi:hypothetical protein